MEYDIISFVHFKEAELKLNGFQFSLPMKQHYYNIIYLRGFFLKLMYLLKRAHPRYRGKSREGFVRRDRSKGYLKLDN